MSVSKVIDLPKQIVDRLGYADVNVYGPLSALQRLSRILRRSVGWMPASILCLACQTTYAQDSANASIMAQCSGNSSSQVAIRWGAPDHQSNQYMPLFTIPCNTGVQGTALQILHYNSQFEVQTEGGPQTSYMLNITTNGPNEAESGSIKLTHHGSPADVTVTPGDFALSRSSGPNKYGEQNFRVQLTGASAANARIRAHCTGNRSNAQIAIRWGHPDFHDREYFALWTIKASDGEQEKAFRLSDINSEFEIQTEGGVGTAYDVSIWLDTGNGTGMQPSVDIVHNLATEITTHNSPGVDFQPSSGNVYGEMNVDVTIPGLPAAPEPDLPPPPPPCPTCQPYWFQLNSSPGSLFPECFTVQIVAASPAAAMAAAQAQATNYIVTEITEYEYYHGCRS